jgi:hypothetical protein
LKSQLAVFQKACQLRELILKLPLCGIVQFNKVSSLCTAGRINYLKPKNK